MDDEDLTRLDENPEKDIDEIAKEYGISDRKKLNDALFCAGDAHFQAWLEDEYPVDQASQKKIVVHIEEALLLLKDSDYRRALELTGVNVVRLQQNLRKAVITIKEANQPVRRGRRRKKAIRAFVNTLVAYWTDELAPPEFTQGWWKGKDRAGQPQPASEGTRFVMDMAKVIEFESDEMSSLPRATAEAVAALRIKG